jgi:hypothetical protein
MFASSSLKTIFVAAALVGVSFASAAEAREQVISARLTAPITATRVIADNSIWTCAGDSCQARASASVHSCRQFVREANALVVSYADLTQEQIAACNLSSSASRGGEAMQARN